VPQILGLVLLPVLAWSWSIRRQAAVPNYELHATAMKAVGQRMSQAVEHRRNSLLGRQFPRPRATDVAGRQLPIGLGHPTRVLFLNTGPFGEHRHWQQLLQQYPGEYLIVVMTQPPKQVQQEATAARSPRMYFVCDSATRLHDWYGAGRNCTFDLDRQGRVVRIRPTSSTIHRSLT